MTEIDLGNMKLITDVVIVAAYAWRKCASMSDAELETAATESMKRLDVNAEIIRKH